MLPEPATLQCWSRVSVNWLRALIALPLVLIASQLCAEPTSSVIAPQQCVWRSGQITSWSAPDPEAAWKPYTSWKLNPREPYVWLQCAVDPASLRGLQMRGDGELARSEL